MGSDRRSGRCKVEIRPGRLALAFRSCRPCAFYPAKSMPLLQRSAASRKAGQPRASTIAGMIADVGLRLRAKAVIHVEIKPRGPHVALS